MCGLSYTFVSDWKLQLLLLLVLFCYLFMIALFKTKLNQLVGYLFKNMHLKQCENLTVLLYHYIHI